MTELTSKPNNLFRRLEIWRLENGRDPVTGSRRQRRPKINDAGILMAALCVAERHGSDHLIDHYRRLRAELEWFAAGPDHDETVVDGAGI